MHHPGVPALQGWPGGSVKQHASKAGTGVSSSVAAHHVPLPVVQRSEPVGLLHPSSRTEPHQLGALLAIGILEEVEAPIT